MAFVIVKPERETPPLTRAPLSAASGGPPTVIVPAVKDQVRDTIYAQRDPLVRLAHDIHDHPELAFFEDYAAARLTDFLVEQGFAVRKGIGGMPTAFVATIGHGPLHVAFCAEYDALPPTLIYDRSKPQADLMEVWLTPERQDAPLLHACGHHLIAGAAVAAAMGLRDIADGVGLTVSVFGTPAEEMYGLPEPRDGRLAPGKVVLLAGGAFEGVHAALMIHPFPTAVSVFIPSRASLRLRARFSKASAGGRTLAEAELQGLEATLKQTILSYHQTPSIFVARCEDQNTGAQVDIFWMHRSLADMAAARDAVRHCIKAAASTWRVQVEIVEYASGAEMRHDPKLRAAFRQNSIALGRVRGQEAGIRRGIRESFSSPKLPLLVRLLAGLAPRLLAARGLFMDWFPIDIAYGTDLGSVSQVIPAIHPFIGVGGTAGPHMAEFAADTDTDEAHRAMLDGAIALAWTAVDAATDPKLKAYLLEWAARQSVNRVGAEAD